MGTPLRPKYTLYSYMEPLGSGVLQATALLEERDRKALRPQFGVHTRKSIDFLGIKRYNKNPGTKKALKCSTPILCRRRT